MRFGFADFAGLEERSEGHPFGVALRAAFWTGSTTLEVMRAAFSLMRVRVPNSLFPSQHAAKLDATNWHARGF